MNQKNKLICPSGLLKNYKKNKKSLSFTREEKNHLPKLILFSVWTQEFFIFFFMTKLSPSFIPGTKKITGEIKI